MITPGKSWGWQFGFVRAWAMGGAITLMGGLALSGNRALAQIIPDATLGAERSIVTPNANVRTLPAELIEGGALRGTNLFHSFQEFNVGNGQRVYFANPAGIENILSRVTGNNLSKIFGTLGVNGGANLFLINPNGIIFGSNARLDIAGSFVGSTANSLVWGNGLEFSANNPQAPPLLTIKLRPGLQYGTNQPGATIANAGTLAVGKDLTLAAGNLDLQGQLSAGGNLTLQAQDTVRVRDSVTNPFVAAAGGQLLVEGDRTVDIFALNHPESGLFSGGDMVLRSANSVIGDAHYRSGSNFRVEQLDGSLGNLASPNDPVFEVAGDFSLANYTGASLQILAGGSVNIPGTVTINGSSGVFNDSSFSLSDGTPLTISGTTQATVDIRAGTTGFFGTPTPGTPTSADITIGTIEVKAPNGLVFLTNQYQPNPALTRNIQVTNIRVNDRDGGFSGNGGDVIIDSRGDITLPNSGRIQTSSGTGNAGNVTLIANGSFLMNPGSQIQAVTSGRGNAGDVTMKIGGAVTLLGNLNQIGSTDGTAIYTNVEREAVGNGGDINIQAGSLSLTDRVELQAIVRGASGLDSAGRGNAGNVTINVRDAVVLGGTSQFRNGMFTVNSGEIGNGGNIDITAGSLSITNGSLLTYVTGQGRAGKITINVHDTFTIAGINPVSGGSNLLYAGTGGASGEAGIIDITAGTVRIADGALVNASSYNSANGGDVTVNANVLELTGGGQILALPYAQGNGGNVTLNVSDRLTISGSDPTYKRRLIRFGPDVVTNQGPTSGIYTGYALGLVETLAGLLVKSTGNGGNISITGPRELSVDGGELFTGAFNTGNAGNLSITQTGSVNLANVASITTSTFGKGNAGRLFIDTGKLNLQNQSFIVTATAGDGNAGELTIHANDSVEVSSGSKITSDTLESGNGGTLTIETGTLTIQDGSEVSAKTSSSGQGGTLRIRASDSVNVVNGGYLVTASADTGNSGDLFIDTGRLSILNSSVILILSWLWKIAIFWQTPSKVQAATLRLNHQPF